MKKIFITVCVALAACAVQAQTVKIMKNGVAIATFDATEFDEVVFSPVSDTPSGSLKDLVGEYDAHLAVSLVEMPQQGVLINEDTKFTIEATADKTMTIALPGCYYAAMNMTMPGVTLSDVEVAVAEGVYTFNKEYSFTEEGTGKAVSGAVSGTVKADRTFEITNKMKYGSMPFTLNMVFTPLEK